MVLYAGGMSRRACARAPLSASLLALAGCTAIAPPPMVAFHGDTTAAPVDTTVAMLVVGVAGELLGPDGWGVAVRVERQQTARTTVGGELTGGRGPHGEDGRRWLLALRGYGRVTPGAADYVAATYGLGVSVMDVGLITLTGHAGGAVSYPNDYVAPFLQLSAAFALPLRRGRRWGDKIFGGMCLACEDSSPTVDEPAPVRAELYVIADGGAVGLLGDTGNRISIDLGYALALRADEVVIAASIADAQR